MPSPSLTFMTALIGATVSRNAVPVIVTFFGGVRIGSRARE
jgi:hypothetical protein